MRSVAVAVSSVLIAVACAQTSRPVSLFTSVRPQVFVVVQKHKLGPDLVEITMVDPEYSDTVLSQQISALGTILGSAPRAVQVFRYGAEIGGKKPLHATLTVDGLISADKTQIRLEPIVKMLTGAPAPTTIEGIDVLYRDITVSPNIVRRWFPKDGSVEAEAMSSGNPAGVEYRIKLNTQDPAKVLFPGEGAPATLEKKTDSTATKQDWPMIAVIGVAALAAGALVYSALLRARPGPQTPRNKRK